jgi:oligoendopeptidase F
MWRELEQTYQPWLTWGDLAHPASGRRWQAQLHIYGYPFYFIDYALAFVCALQFWQRAMVDRDTTMRDFVKLCRRGGEAPFRELVTSAGLESPFENACVAEVVAHARRELLRE